LKDNSSLLVLRDDRIVETVAKLQRRIEERFPGAGLSQLCEQLLDVSRKASERSRWIGKPIRPIRVAGYAMAALLVASFVGFVAYGLRSSESENIGFIELVQAIEAGLNDIIFFALAIWFLVSLETRIKRRRALAAVHELRSIAHIIDMHQLTKDPERVVRDWLGTENSPKQQMTPFQLNRYLDYCSEMLSLTGKIASLYVQHFDDADAVAAVSEVEQLSTGLSRKIWQKIMILHQTPDTELLHPKSFDAEPVAGQPTASQIESSQPSATSNSRESS
jgi:hypothetical protein